MLEVASSQSSNSEGLLAGISQARVLVVDDDHIVQQLLKKFLERSFFAYEGANSAIEALQLLERSEEELPELIISDIVMPEMDGLAFCNALKQNPKLEKIPVIFLTGLSDLGMLNRAYDAGASDYIVKPIQQAEVASRASHHILEYRRLKQAEQKISKLDELNKSKTRFLGAASHDLRNPLVSIRGISQYLETERFGPLNEHQKELVHSIVDASKAMLSLVEDLLDNSMFESGQLELDLEKQSLREVAASCITLHSTQAARKSINLGMTEGVDRCEIPFDRQRMSRVIDNLISNALKFSPPDTQVSVAIEELERECTLSIEDQGPGIPEDQFALLFKEFGRTSNQPTGGESSTGLGLFICKRIVEAHGGSIKAQNKPQGGAKFTVSLSKYLS